MTKTPLPQTDVESKPQSTCDFILEKGHHKGERCRALATHISIGNSKYCKRHAALADTRKAKTAEQLSQARGDFELITYKLALTESQTIVLSLPLMMSQADADRIKRFVDALVNKEKDNA